MAQSRAELGGGRADSASSLALRLAGIAALAVLLVAMNANAQPPTVNGLFYGDGDDARYIPYATSAGGSKLYSYFDLPTSKLYVALVVSHSVNDTVCSSTRAYTQSAGWGPPRPCNRLYDSEFAEFKLECAPGSPRAWTWRQSLGVPLNTSNPPRNWVTTVSAGAAPPSYLSSSSWVANVNAWQNAAATPWNLYAGGQEPGGWTSPFVSSTPNNVAAVPGYNTFSTYGQIVPGGSTTLGWEWSMVYEWSVDLGPAGASCGNQPIYFITGVSHHSPAKNDSENDPFPPPGDPTDTIFSDWGDLPDSYGTTAATGGARHYLVISGPYLGEAIQPEQDGQPTPDATGDGSEEDGVTVTVTSNWTAGSTQWIDVEVGNAGSGALLGAWFDWNDDGDFADPGEFFSWSVVNGTNSLPVTVGTGFSWQTSKLATRFRIFSSAAAAPGGSLTQADSVGTATDGEVEDYIFPPGTLPVKLNAFESRPVAAGRIAVSWQTASETDNVGFQVEGLVGGRWVRLGELVESRGMHSALPQLYEVEVEAPAPPAEIRLVDFDTRGRTRSFGPYAVGARHGEVQPQDRIDWGPPRREREERLLQRGFVETGPAMVARAGAESDTGSGNGRWRRLAESSEALATPETVPVPLSASAGKPVTDVRVPFERGPLTHVAVRETGIQRVSYEALRAGGLDLAGVRARTIALTHRGDGVPRWISGGPFFGPGSVIEFLASAPTGTDALYLDANLYQVSTDQKRAIEAQSTGVSRGVAKASETYPRQVTIDRPLAYHTQSPTGDPWVEQTILTRRGTPRVVTVDLPVSGPVARGASRLRIGLGAITDLPDVGNGTGGVVPEHNVEVGFRSADGSYSLVTRASASGNRDWAIEADLPDGVLQTGVNQMELRFTTDYLYSLVVLDRYGVSYRSPYLGPTLDFAPDAAARDYRVEGFATPDVVVFAEQAGGAVSRVAPWVVSGGSGYQAVFGMSKVSRFWVTEAPHRPSVFATAAPADLLAGSGDLVVIADSSFIGTPALGRYLAAKGEFRPVVVDLEDVFNGFGYGMALPGAITDFLRARDAVARFGHVQLVGTDCYDRRNFISSCVSFVPLPTAPVGVTVYSPSQNRLVDLDGDGVGDKAIGQFSVRTEAELETIVSKGESFVSSGLAGAASALLIAEESDGVHDLRGQVNRVSRRLGWRATEVLDLADHPEIATARAALSASLSEGRTLTVFSGHSSPSVWAYRSLLTSTSAGLLTNADRPTLMVPLACETTWDVSPTANVLGHQLLFGGNRGAVAISGAASLASLSENERMADHVLGGLDAGLTLGQAVLEGRKALGRSYQTLQDNWTTQGDVTTRLKR